MAFMRRCAAMFLIIGRLAPAYTARRHDGNVLAGYAPAATGRLFRRVTNSLQRREPGPYQHSTLPSIHRTGATLLTTRTWVRHQHRAAPRRAFR